MNRRKFIGSVIGIVGVIFIPSSPTKQWHDKGYYGPLTAEQFMTKVWNEHTKGTGINHWPHKMFATPALYDSFESNLQCLQRFTDSEQSFTDKALMFKSTKVYRWPDISPNKGDKHWMVLMGNKCYDISMYGWPV